MIFKTKKYVKQKKQIRKIITIFSPPFCSILEITLQDDRLAPTIFLYATDNKLRSSDDKVLFILVTCFIAVAMSSYLIIIIIIKNGHSQ